MPVSSFICLHVLLHHLGSNIHCFNNDRFSSLAFYGGLQCHQAKELLFGKAMLVVLKTQLVLFV